MKRIITTLLTIASLSGFSQTKHLPPTVTITLSDKQIIAISAKIDSLTMLLNATSTLPSNQVNQFNQRVNIAFQPMWVEVQKGMIADSVKKGAGK